jgi:hypothetical protein
MMSYVTVGVNATPPAQKSMIRSFPLINKTSLMIYFKTLNASSFAGVGRCSTLRHQSRIDTPDGDNPVGAAGHEYFRGKRNATISHLPRRILR